MDTTDVIETTPRHQAGPDAIDPALAGSEGMADGFSDKGLEDDEAKPTPDAADEDDTPAVSADQFNTEYETSKRELWSYYGYGIANNGLGLFNYGPTAFQNLLAIAAGEEGKIMFAGSLRTVNSMVLLANGISCAVNVVLFLAIGSLADYGTWRPNILIFWTVAAVGLSFGWLGVHEADKWQVAMGLYIVGLIVYQMCLSFWTAAFPGLARNSPPVREAAQKYSAGQITRKEYDHTDMIHRNRVSNESFIVQSGVEIVIIAIVIGIEFAVHANDGQDQNNRGLSILIAFAGGVWAIVSIPWFLFEKRRPGQTLPPNTNFFTAGLLQLYTAGREIIQLKQSLLYLFGYFLLSDSLNTTVTVIGTLQNEIASYSTITIAYLLLVGIAAQLAGILTFWLVQKRFQLKTKTMLNVVLVSIIVLDAWGMIGIWTQRFGFHHLWEIWLYQAYYGFLVCPWYSYSLIMVSEVTPRGREFLFFSLFGCFGRVSSFVGPIVSSAIIDHSATGNTSLPFYFLLGISILASAMLMIFLDVDKSRREQATFLKRQTDKLL